MSVEIRGPVLLGVVLLAAGCAAIKPETPQQVQEKRAKATRPAYNLAGYPPAVKEGYIDGCETAKRSQYAHKDAKRMADDPQYAMGWNDGHGICAKR
jgi:hypothetical protein